MRGPVTLSGNRAPVFAGATVKGPLSCTGNATAPDNLDIANTVHGPTTGQCRVVLSPKLLRVHARFVR